MDAKPSGEMASKNALARISSWVTGLKSSRNPSWRRMKNGLKLGDGERRGRRGEVAAFNGSGILINSHAQHFDVINTLGLRVACTRLKPNR